MEMINKNLENSDNKSDKLYIYVCMNFSVCMAYFGLSNLISRKEYSL